MRRQTMSNTTSLASAFYKSSFFSHGISPLNRPQDHTITQSHNHTLHISILTSKSIFLLLISESHSNLRNNRPRSRGWTQCHKVRWNGPLHGYFVQCTESWKSFQDGCVDYRCIRQPNPTPIWKLYLWDIRPDIPGEQTVVRRLTSKYCLLNAILTDIHSLFLFFDYL